MTWLTSLDLRQRSKLGKLAQAMRFLFTEEELKLLDSLPDEDEDTEAHGKSLWPGSFFLKLFENLFSLQVLSREQPDLLNLEKAKEDGAEGLRLANSSSLLIT